MIYTSWTKTISCIFVKTFPSGTKLVAVHYNEMYYDSETGSITRSGIHIHIPEMMYPPEMLTQCWPGDEKAQQYITKRVITPLDRKGLVKYADRLAQVAVMMSSLTRGLTAAGSNPDLCDGLFPQPGRGVTQDVIIVSDGSHPHRGSSVVVSATISCLSRQSHVIIVIHGTHPHRSGWEI